MAKEKRQLAAICLSYCLLTYAVFLFHVAFPGGTALNDLGAYKQMLWGLLHEGAAPHTASLSMEVNWFGIHFDPLVVLIGFPAAFDGWEWWLNFMQSVMQSLAGIPIYLLAREKGFSHSRALLWVCIMFLNPFYFNAALWDFHETSIACPLMALLCYGVFTNRWRITLLSCLLLLFTKEHYGITVAAAGIVWWQRTKDWKKGAFLAAIGAAFFIALVFFLMPYLAGSDIHPMLAGNYNRYTWLKAPLEKMPALIGVRGVYSLRYLINLTAPLLFQPFLGLQAAFLAAADLLANSLSMNTLMINLGSYHSGPVIPAFIAACLVSGADKKRQAIQNFVLGTTVLSLMLFSIPSIFLETRKDLWRWSPDSEISDIRKLLSPEDRVLAQNDIGTFFAGRKVIYVLPPFVPKRKLFTEDVDVIIIRDSYPFKTEKTVFFGNPYHPDKYRRALRRIMGFECFSPIYRSGPWLVLRHNGKACGQEVLVNE